jgi:hypothetical protein
MAHDAVTAYIADVTVGNDALLVCDTKEMCDALNRRIHNARVQADAPTVTGARGQRIAVGDLVISRRNDSAVKIYEGKRDFPAADPVRNGNRWRVAAIDAERNRIAAQRLSDAARAVFNADYVREHITHGYAVTVLTAQGVTADTTHAVLGENTTRATLYVAMTRGRESNTAHPLRARRRGVRIRRMVRAAASSSSAPAPTSSIVGCWPAMTAACTAHIRPGVL